MTPIGRIAAFAAGLRREDMPPEVRAVARRCLLDTVGVALAGAQRPVAGRIAEVARATFAPGAARVLGSSDRLVPAGAALANGTAAHALDFDDNCYAGFVHGSAVIVPAALAVAETRGVSGADLVTAIVAGSEAEFALGAAATASLYERGWWTTGVLGPVGAAVAAACLLGAGERAIADAVGLAVAGAGGAKACFGTDAKPALCGRASETGVLAATMAAAGIAGPHDAVEHPRGFAALLNAGVLEPSAFASLGRSWRLLDPGVDVKRVPVCLSAHAAADAVMDLLAEGRIAPGEVESVVCDVGPVVRANLAYERPQTPQEAQFSLPFAIGCVLVHGDIGLQHLDPATLADPALGAAMARVETVTTARWDDGEIARRSPEGAHVALILRDGRRLERFNGMARGTTARPLAPGEVDAKFLSCAAPVLGEENACSLLGRLHAVEELPATAVLPD